MWGKTERRSFLSYSENPLKQEAPLLVCSKALRKLSCLPGLWKGCHCQAAWNSSWSSPKTACRIASGGTGETASWVCLSAKWKKMNLCSNFIMWLWKILKLVLFVCFCLVLFLITGPNELRQKPQWDVKITLISSTFMVWLNSDHVFCWIFYLEQHTNWVVLFPVVWALWFDTHF